MDPNQLELAKQIAIVMAHGGLVATLVVPTVETLKGRIPQVQGWVALLVSAIAAVAVTSLFFVPRDPATALEMARVALVAFLYATGYTRMAKQSALFKGLLGSGGASGEGNGK